MQSWVIEGCLFKKFAIRVQFGVRSMMDEKFVSAGNLHPSRTLQYGPSMARWRQVIFINNGKPQKIKDRILLHKVLPH